MQRLRRYNCCQILEQRQLKLWALSRLRIPLFWNQWYNNSYIQQIKRQHSRHDPESCQLMLSNLQLLLGSGYEAFLLTLRGLLGLALRHCLLFFVCFTGLFVFAHHSWRTSSLALFHDNCVNIVTHDLPSHRRPA